VSNGASGEITGDSQHKEKRRRKPKLIDKRTEKGRIGKICHLPSNLTEKIYLNADRAEEGGLKNKKGLRTRKEGQGILGRHVVKRFLAAYTRIYPRTNRGDEQEWGRRTCLRTLW